MTASKNKTKQKNKKQKGSEAVIFWCLYKPVLRELNDAILTKEFSFVGVKEKQNKNIAADHDKPTLRELNDAILTKEFSFVGVQKKNIAADHVRKPRILTMTMPQTNFLSYYLRDTY